MKEKDNVFKLIGLRVLSDCEKSLRKVLVPETTYFFCNDYEDDGAGSVRLKRDAQPLSSSFFCIGERNAGPNVSVSCIVGHNGDGKSSLIELMIRVINNFAYLSGFLSDHGDLKYIPGLHAKLFYFANNSICCISCCGDRVVLTIDGKNTTSWSYRPGKVKAVKKTKKDFIRNKCPENIFYTLVSNYSLYAYNSEEFKIETHTWEAEESWIAALFHKNDAYQTPIVLSPHRKRGVIDVNRQYYLSMQRLSELFFDCQDGKYRISDTEVVEGIVYSLEKESKLITATIFGYLFDTEIAAKNVMVFSGKFNAHKKTGKYVLNLSKESDFQVGLNFWENFDRRFYDTGLITLVNKNNNLIVTSSDSSGALRMQTDLCKYLNTLKTKKYKQKDYPNVKEKINEFLSKGGGELTFMQFQRLYLVFEVYLQWLSKLENESLKPFKPNKMTVRDHAVWYLIYKTIRMIENYPDFMAGGIKDYEIPHYFFHEEVRKNNIKKWFDAIDKDIKKDKSHLTLKLRQTLCFLDNGATATMLLSDNVDTEDKKRNVSEAGYSYYIDCEKYYNAIGNKTDIAAALPPPIFDYDFVISRDNNSLYPLSKMSSGERQLLNSASAIVYHLKNIANSKPQGLKIVYRNVNVILEEVELYFHPEYQRRYIKYLLDQIKFAHLPSSMGINLLFVTHSPFILSDIPRQQVLFLRDGKMDRSMQEDTFGANIHTLLQNGFFLGSLPIGEFAKEKISEMFKMLNKSETLINTDYEQLTKEIPLVSEPLLRGQLMRLYSQRKNFEQGTYMDKIESLEKRIRDLERQLNDNN
jgi:hypothetical protein